MSLLGGLRSGTGGTKTTGGPTDSGGGTGTIESITSPDGSIVVTNPTGPDVQIQIPPSASFELALSFGHGMEADTHLPSNTAFWLSPTTIADIAAGFDPSFAVREWPLDQSLENVGLDLVVDLSDFPGKTLPVIVTVDGVDTAIVITVPDAISSPTVLQASAALAVSAGSAIGVRVDGSLIFDGALIMQARLHGSAGGAGGGAGLTEVTHDFTLQGKGTVLDPLGTKIRSLSGTNGVVITSSSGNYTARGAYLPPVVSGPLGGAGGGLLYTDVPATGRRFENGTQLVSSGILDLLALNNQQYFDWSFFTTEWMTEGAEALITGAWIVILQELLGAVTTAPEISLILDDGTTDVCTPGGITANAGRFAFPSFKYLIPVDTNFNANIPIEYLSPTVGGGPPGGNGLFAKVTKAGVGPATFGAKVLLEITLDLAGKA